MLYSNWKTKTAGEVSMGEIITITDFFLYKRNMRMTTEKN